MVVDTHCHLNHPDFDADRDAVVDRAVAAGVGAMVVIGTDIPSSERAVELAHSRAELWAAVGVHPHEAASLSHGDLERLAGLAAEERVVAVGETGLDFYRDLAPRDLQERAFRAQIELALRSRLPVVVHTRDSTAAALAILLEYRASGLKAVLHCWSGSEDEARQVWEAGWWLGFGGVLTFKNANSLRRIAASAPASALLLETDSPYLAPEPHRGRRNEPAYLLRVAAQLAKVRSAAPAETTRETTANSMRAFPRVTSVAL